MTHEHYACSERVGKYCLASDMNSVIVWLVLEVLRNTARPSLGGSWQRQQREMV